MTRDNAINEAARLAKQRNEEMTIVYEDEYEGFLVATSDEMNGYFFGSTVYGIMAPDGELSKPF